MRAWHMLRMTIVGFSLSGVAHAGLWFKLPTTQDETRQFGKPSQTELNPDHIKLIIWNQYKGKERRFKSEYQRLSKDRDVMLLQEAYMDGKMDKLYASNRFFETIFAASFIYRYKSRATGVANAARVPASTYQAMRSSGVELAGGTPKMILFSTYPIKDRNEDLLVVNIHALNSVSWQSLAVQVLDALAVVKQHDGSVVFGGDFNTWSKNKLNFVMRAMERAGLSEVKFKHEERKMRVFGRALDHVFVRGVEITDAVVEKTDGADHQPLLLSFKVR